MSTAQHILERALYRIGATSPINEIKAESLRTCWYELVSMLEEWEGQRINTGIRVPELDDNGNPRTEAKLAEPRDTTSAIVDNLARRIAPTMRKEVSNELRLNAIKTMHEMEKKYQYKASPKLKSSGQHGSGNRGYRW